MPSPNEGGRGFRARRLERIVTEIFETMILPGLTDPLLEELRVANVEISSNLSCIRVVLAFPCRPKLDREALSEALKRARPCMTRELCANLRIKRMALLKLSLLPVPVWPEDGAV